MKIAIAGNNNIAVRCLEYLIGIREAVVAVVATREDPKDGWQQSLADAARRNGIVLFRQNINSVVASLRALRPDIILSLQYPYLFKQEVLTLPPRPCINLHFGKLPRYRGCYPIAWALLNSERVLGATYHYMDETFDTGDIIAQRDVPIEDHETARQLYEKATDTAFGLFTETFPLIKAGAVTTSRQDPDLATCYAKDSIDFSSDKFVDWTKPAVDIHRHIRAFTFPPFQCPAVRAGPQALDVWDSTVLAAENEGSSPGTILGLVDGRLAVATEHGIVGLARFRFNGADMTAPEFLREQIVQVGTVLQSAPQKGQDAGV